MGMDQHRAQISAEWIDTITGEISRARIAPADRAGVRKFLARFEGEDLEVALEATTGWRSWSRNSSGVGADVHLAEASALKGKKKRAKTDWADARHLRELLLIGPAAGVVDPARASARSPRQGPLPAHAVAAADGMAAADAGGALSPRASGAYYLQAAERIGGNRACLALARKLLKRCYHILTELGDPALEPVAN
jgi:hypothetical protein